jgi:hypothetical protein
MAAPEPMSSALRISLIVAGAALWLSGCAWLAAHYFFGHVTDFGVLPNPWEAPLLHLHGWLGGTGVFLLGFVTARHVTDRWLQQVRRISGWSMAGVAALLLLTGYALYYTTGGWHDAVALLHEIIGAAAILFAITHWRRYRAAPALRSRTARPHAT